MKTKEGMTAHERKNTQLIALFDEILRRRPDLLEEIPNAVSLVMQIEGDGKFNAWARRIADVNSPDRSKLFVKFTLKARLTSTSKKPLSWKKVEEMELQSA
jgi:hypothetical protein